MEVRKKDIEFAENFSKFLVVEEEEAENKSEAKSEVAKNGMCCGCGDWHEFRTRARRQARGLKRSSW